jgi:hypothetical protein
VKQISDERNIELHELEVVSETVLTIHLCTGYRQIRCTTDAISSTWEAGYHAFQQLTHPLVMFSLERLDCATHFKDGLVFSLAVSI